MTDSSTPQPHLQRALKPRHLNMIAIGGSIGTGLFVASGATVASAGPGGALLAYALIGVMVYFLMTSLGEMAAHMPVSGSFSTYGSRFVDDGFGFALGWNYWYNWAVTIAAELVAAQLIMSFWLPEVPGIYWSALFLGLMFLLNVVSVKGFGESEFWFALIKVVTVVVFIGIGLATIFGIMGGIESPGFSNFTTGDAPFVGGLQAMVGVAMIAGFSFQGTELIGIAAAESENPKRNIPIAIRQVFWRILMFYILAIFVIGMLIPYNEPSLLQNDASDINVSALHPAVRTRRLRRRGQRDERGHPHRHPLGRQLGHVCLHPHALHPGHARARRRACSPASRANGVPRNALYRHHPGGRPVFLHFHRR